MWKKTRRKMNFSWSISPEEEYTAEELESYVIWNKITRGNKICLNTIQICGMTSIDPPRKKEQTYKFRWAPDIENPERTPYFEAFIARKKGSDEHRILIDGDYWGLSVLKKRDVPISTIEKLANWDISRVEMDLINRAASYFFGNLEKDQPRISISWRIIRDKDHFITEGMPQIRMSWPQSYPCLFHYLHSDYLYINVPEDKDSPVISF